MTDVINPTALAQFPDTIVYEAAAPTGAYADLDLSASVGRRKAFVNLLFRNYDAVDSANIALRTNGKTGNYAFLISALGPGGEAIVQGITTDANGIIEWTANANADMRITLEGYFYA
jgi:hypothetical protein